MSTEDINKLSDPTVVGPGTWWLIHTKAKAAVNDKLIDEFINLMYFLVKNFSCKKCRKHIKQYIDTHPFSDLKNLRGGDGERIGMFKWSWMFHNAVNTRINKPYVDWETAVEMFYDEPEVCSKNCDDTDDTDDTDDAVTENITELPTSDRKSKLAQGYFMSIGIPNTLKKNGIPPDILSNDKTNNKNQEDSWVSFATVGN